MRIARTRKVFVIEDTCQAVGGSYKGRKLGSIGDIGAYSFNFYKNMSAGEGGGVVTNDDAVAKRVNCAIDPCHAFWTGRDGDSKPFAGNGARASEFMGAVLNVQLDRIDGIIAALRRERDTILDGISDMQSLGLRFSPLNSRDHDCATNVFLTLPDGDTADKFIKVFPSVIAGKTGRHTYTEWDQVLMGEGAAHPLMNPYNMAANAECRRTYSKDMCARSLEILNRSILVPTNPEHSAQETADIIHNIKAATRVALGHVKREEEVVRKVEAVDSTKYDLKVVAW
jgi:dTDP-4-amino-4,6-dideoxygalactose transaminase